MKLPSLEEFLAQPRESLSLYIKYKTIECYMRKGPRMVDGKIVNALTMANIKNTRRANNVEIDPSHKRTGLFSEFERLVRKAATENGYDGVYAECVHNPFLPDVLTRYGYKRINIGDYDEHNYWCEV